MHRILPILFFAAWFAGCEKPLPVNRLAGFEVHGIDVSRYQKQISWDSVAAADISFAFVKATEGEAFQDTFFCKNWDKMAENGLKRGAYHFFRPKTDAEKQAWNFLSLVEMMPGDLPPVLDIETTDGLPHAVLLEKIRTWLRLVETHGHARPIIYSNYNFYERWLAGHFQEYPIWIARYAADRPELSFKKAWAFWQYGSNGRLAGVDGPVDFNVFLGSKTELEKLLLPPIRYSEPLLPVINAAAAAPILPAAKPVSPKP